MRTSQHAALAALVTVCGLLAAALPASAQTALDGQRPSALSRENLDKPRPKPPFDLTGTWDMVIDQKNGAVNFLPRPKLKPAAAAASANYQEYRAKGLEYRDDSGACWPLGMPRMMTRYWPIEIIQLPTMIQLITMFDHSLRWIYMDGRPHPKEEDVVETYAGHSIGHWDGDTLVIDTVGMTDDHHWIEDGVPAGPKLHVVERIRLVDGGKALEDQFTMTDPDNWEGDWVSTKRFNRQDRTDIEEHVCIYEQVNKLPSFKFNIRE